MAWVIEDKRNKFRVKCKCCGSIIGFYNNDIRDDGEEYFGQYHLCSSIKCPACGSGILVRIDGKLTTNVQMLP